MSLPRDQKVNKISSGDVSPVRVDAKQAAQDKPDTSNTVKASSKSSKPDEGMAEDETRGRDLSSTRKIEKTRAQPQTNSQMVNRQRTLNQTPVTPDAEAIIKPEEWYNIPPCIKIAIEKIIDLQQSGLRQLNTMEKRLQDGLNRVSTAQDKTERSLKDLVESTKTDLNEKIGTSLKMTKDLKEVESKNHSGIEKEISNVKKILETQQVTVKENGGQLNILAQNFEINRDNVNNYIRSHSEQIKKLEDTVATQLCVEDFIGGEKCPYADFTEFVIKTHLNGGKAMNDQFQKLELVQAKLRNEAINKLQLTVKAQQDEMMDLMTQKTQIIEKSLVEKLALLKEKVTVLQTQVTEAAIKPKSVPQSRSKSSEPHFSADPNQAKINEKILSLVEINQNFNQNYFRKCDRQMEWLHVCMQKERKYVDQLKYVFTKDLAELLGLQYPQIKANLFKDDLVKDDLLNTDLGAVFQNPHHDWIGINLGAKKEQKHDDHEKDVQELDSQNFVRQSVQQHSIELNATLEKGIRSLWQTLENQNTGKFKISKQQIVYREREDYQVPIAKADYDAFKVKFRVILQELYELLALEKPEVLSRTSSESPHYSETISGQEDDDNYDNFIGVEHAGSTHSQNKSVLKQKRHSKEDGLKSGLSKQPIIEDLKEVIIESKKQKPDSERKAQSKLKSEKSEQEKAEVETLKKLSNQDVLNMRQMSGFKNKKDSVFSEIKSQKSNETIQEKTKNVSLRVTSISIQENQVDERKKSLQHQNEKKSQIESEQRNKNISQISVDRTPPFNSSAFKKDLLNEIYSYVDAKIEFIQNLIPAEPSEHDSSSTDSAYQMALEFGGGYYSAHISDRARHRMFRKFVAKQTEVALKRNQFLGAFKTENKYVPFRSTEYSPTKPAINLHLHERSSALVDSNSLQQPILVIPGESGAASLQTLDRKGKTSLTNKFTDGSFQNATTQRELELIVDQGAMSSRNSARASTVVRESESQMCPPLIHSSHNIELGGIYGKLPIISSRKVHNTRDNMQWNLDQALMLNHESQSSYQQVVRNQNSEYLSPAKASLIKKTFSTLKPMPALINEKSQSHGRSFPVEVKFQQLKTQNKFSPRQKPL